jgi:hypothetical protein
MTSSYYGRLRTQKPQIITSHADWLHNLLLIEHIRKFAQIHLGEAAYAFMTQDIFLSG